MLDLSPTKLIIIFVVVVVLLGPKKLPEVARQLGAGWRKLRDFHSQLDRELRQSMPDLPSSQEIVRFARSPLTLLNQLADRPAGAGEDTTVNGVNGASPVNGVSPVGGVDGANGAGPVDSVDGANGASPVEGVNGAAPRRTPSNGSFAARSLAALDTDDPSLN